MPGFDWVGDDDFDDFSLGVPESSNIRFFRFANLVDESCEVATGHRVSINNTAASVDGVSRVVLGVSSGVLFFGEGFSGVEADDGSHL